MNEFIYMNQKTGDWNIRTGLVYPKPEGAGRRPKELEMMPRIHFLQHGFTLSDPAMEEALYDSRAMRRFAGIDLGTAPVPDETTSASVLCAQAVFGLVKVCYRGLDKNANRLFLACWLVNLYRARRRLLRLARA